MNQKTGRIIVISIIISLVLCNFTLNASSQDMQTNEIFFDELDQSQETYNEMLIFGNLTEEMSTIIAQSFKPQKEILTRVQILMGKNLLTHQPCTLTIREELTGENLATASVDSADVPVLQDETDFDNLTWVAFNFADLAVTINETYYFILSTQAEIFNFYYVGISNISTYENGSFHSAIIDDSQQIVWAEIEVYDLCFKTFGTESYEPEVEISDITGVQGLTVTLKNVGGANATDVVVDINITGGILGLIDIQESHTIENIGVNEEKSVLVEPFGLGRIDINVTLGEIIASKSAIVIGRFVLLIPEF